MTNILKSLKELNNNLTWKQEYFREEIGEEEMQELAKLAKTLQNKYNHSKHKQTLLGQFQASNYEYVREIDTERNNSQYVAKTKNGQPIMYARFEEDYYLNPTNTSEYVNQYKDQSIM